MGKTFWTGLTGFTGSYCLKFERLNDFYPVDPVNPVKK
jgi:hypothetical protein